MSSVLPIRQTESLISLRRNCRLFQQNRFSFDFASASVSATALPPAWTMILIAFFGFIAYRRKNATQAV